MQLFGFLLCGAVVGWTKCTQIQNANCLHSKEMSDNNTEGMITLSLSPIPSPVPQIVTIDSDSNEPTMFNGVGWQPPIIPPRMNDPNLLPNSFKILATMAAAHPTAERQDANYSPQSPELTEPPPISTPTMNLSTIEGWETAQTTTDDNTFYSDDGPRRLYLLLSSPFPNRHLANWNENWALESPSQERRSVAARFRGLWTVAPWTGGHPTFVVNKLMTRDWKLHTCIFHCLYLNDT